MPTENRESESHRAKTGHKRVVVMGKDSEHFAQMVREAGFEIVPHSGNPDLVIAYGGDGSLLGADREYPEIPKVAIRRDSEFEKCAHHQNEDVLRRVAEGKQSVSLLPRVEAFVNGRHIQGINDIVFHNAYAPSAVRYRVRIDGEEYNEEIVGDGLVVSTPFGSTAYYRSITNSVFRVGLGLAFNNSTQSINHLVLDSSSTIEVLVTRGPGLLFSDNLPTPVRVDREDTIRIQASSSRAEIWELGTLTCLHCFSRQTNLPAGFRHV